MKSLFEYNGGTYCKQGDYLIPNLALSKSGENDIGIYGQRHLKFLQEHRRLTYITLLTSGELKEYLFEIDRQAQERFCRIVKQLKTKRETLQRHVDKLHEMEADFRNEVPYMMGVLLSYERGFLRGLAALSLDTLKNK